MATTPRPSVGRKVNYPTSDGKPMAETDVHRDLMLDLISTLEAHFAADPNIYISGNLLLFYEEGNKRKHVSPDVFVVRGIPNGNRDHYLTWVEGKGPDLAIELTSKSTRSEDVKTKMALYRDVLGVLEYFLFDPYQEYLKPSMQGYRLLEGRYEPIEPVDGRLPSEVLGLHLERVGTELRLVQVNGVGRRLLTPIERARQADAAIAEERAIRREAEAEVADQRTRAEQAEAEVANLRLELEALRRQRNGSG
jgi:Uma2 family endonuclease